MSHQHTGLVRRSILCEIPLQNSDAPDQCRNRSTPHLIHSLSRTALQVIRFPRKYKKERVLTLGIFNLHKNREDPSPIPDTFVAYEPDAPNVSMTKNDTFNRKIDLRKKAIALELEELNITDCEARVVFVLDHSGSMAPLYRNGTVQDTLERIFPLALTFDNNGEMEFYLFDTLYKELDTVTTGNLVEYTEHVIRPNHGKYGATCYAPIVEEITARYAKREPSKVPTFVVFITDGNNSDHRKAKDALSLASHYNIFWKFVGIGKEKFLFLEKLDTMDGRFIDNANFVAVNNLAAIDDQTLYKLLLKEYGAWLKLAKNNHLI